MTVDATLRSIYSAADETIADLERLHATTLAARSRHRADLSAVVARLNGSPLMEEEPVGSLERRGRAETDRRPAPQDPPPFVALPQRTTHGGPWGPAMVEKLTREALGKRTW